MSLAQENLVKSSEKFKKLAVELKQAVNLSLTGVTNFVVNHEDPLLVDCFIKNVFKKEELYKNTINIDAVELERCEPSAGHSVKTIDELIFGSFKQKKGDMGQMVYVIDPDTGARIRNMDGFVSRKEVKFAQDYEDYLLVIRNIDYTQDFCMERPGSIERGIWIFDNFRNPAVKKNCKILLISNVPLKLPFDFRSINLDPVNEFEATRIVDRFIKIYKGSGYSVKIDQSQKNKLIRKLCGLTHTKAGDLLGESFNKASDRASKVIDSAGVVRNLRNEINRSFMESATGLSHLTPRPWEDYICPESSNFTYDVKKIVRDFDEIKELQEAKDVITSKGKDTSKTSTTIDAIRARMPHVIILYGKGGVGKCLGKGTKVIMLDGTKRKVEDVVVGDLLMGADSRHRTVLSTTSGVAQLYKVTQKNGKNYICNGLHVLSLKAEGKDKDCPIFISVEDYLKKNKTWKKTHYGWKSGVEFNEKSLPIDPYWMGLWLGDGTALKPAITVGAKDVSTKTWLKEWAAKNNLFVRIETKSATDAVTINFSSRIGSGYGHNQIKESLRDLEVLGNKHIPNIYKINSRQNRLSILAGLIDSDGYKCKSGSLQFFNTNQKLAKDVADLGRSLGLKVFETSSIKELKSYNYKVRCYTVTFGGNLTEIPTKLNRKKGHDNPQKVGVKCGIKVEPFEYGEYYGFTLDGDKQFLLEDYTVTHNSAFPIYFAGLLDFDVWDFNINAIHNKFVGEGGERIRQSLGQISKATHLIVRIDEYDRSMGSTSASGQGMHEAHKQVESEFMNWLQNMQEENFFIKNDIFIIMTTNHKENITGPLLRSGRADLVIDINDFDSSSIKQAFEQAPRRMKNNGSLVGGFANWKKFEKAVLDLDLDSISKLAADKGFTVKDVDVLLQEMAMHKYYFDKDESGIEWNTANFLRVLSNSVGSTSQADTGELILGDRFLLEEHVEEENESQLELPFKNEPKEEECDLLEK